MAQQILEGTWEEIAAHADELRGKRLTVIVEPEMIDSQELETMEEEALSTRQELAEFQARNPGLSDTEAILRYGRCGPMYGMPFVDDSQVGMNDDKHLSEK